MGYSSSKGFGAKPGRDRPERDDTERTREETGGGHRKLSCPGMKVKQMATYERGAGRDPLPPARGQLSLSPVADTWRPSMKEPSLRAKMLSLVNTEINLKVLAPYYSMQLVFSEHPFSGRYDAREESVPLLRPRLEYRTLFQAALLRWSTDYLECVPSIRTRKGKRLKPHARRKSERQSWEG